MPTPTPPKPTAVAVKLPRLTDHAPFAPVAARMVDLEVAAATTRRAARQAAEALNGQAAGGGDGGRFEPSSGATSRYQQATAAADAARQARDDYRRATYQPAHRDAVAAVVPKVVADVWLPALRAVAARYAEAAAELARAQALRDELRTADLLHLPLIDPLPEVDPAGDPADAWSVLGRLTAAAG